MKKILITLSILVGSLGFTQEKAHTEDLLRSSEIAKSLLSDRSDILSLSAEKKGSGVTIKVLNHQEEQYGFDCVGTRENISCSEKSDSSSPIFENRSSGFSTAEEKGLNYFLKVYRMIPAENIYKYVVLKDSGEFFIKYYFNFRGKNYQRFLFCHVHGGNHFDCHKRDAGNVPSFPTFRD